MKHLLLLLLFISAVIKSNAQEQDHAKWNYTVEKKM